MVGGLPHLILCRKGPGMRMTVEAAGSLPPLSLEDGTGIHDPLSASGVEEKQAPPGKDSFFFF